MTFTVEPFTGLDKHVLVDGPVRFYIDNDDVDTHANELLIEALVWILNAYWQPVFGWRCDRDEDEEDRDCFWRTFKDYADADRADYTLCPECGRAMSRVRVD